MTLKHLAAVAVLAGLSMGSALAQTAVSEAWVRGTVPAQKATGAFMKIKSAQGGRLVSVASPVAGLVEVHEMKMDGNVMKMAALPSGLALPAGQTVELKPGGYHVMLMELKQPLKDGDTVPLSLVVEGTDGKRETLELKVPVRPLGAANPAPMHQHQH